MLASLPTARGPLSAALLRAWLEGTPLDPPRLRGIDPLVDDDLHLALWACYQQHYGGFEGLAESHEWDPATLAFRAELEAAFEDALRTEHTAALPEDPVTALRVIAEWSGPPLAATIEREGEHRHLAEFAIHRSAYQLKEADGHTFAIPRIHGPGRAAMIEIQADEYGGGVPGESHAELFAAAMAELDLDPTFGAYVDRLPGATLATDNLVSMLALHRRLRGALIGHLALFEMCSVTPMSRYLSAARRVGGLPALERFYEVHVEADAHHADLALNQMVAPLAEAQPELAADITFGAAALARTESRFARRVLRAWDRDESSLLPARSGVRTPAPVVVATSTATPNTSAPTAASKTTTGPAPRIAAVA